MKCYLCNSTNYTKRDGSVRDDKSLEIYECDNCGLVYLSDHSHINDSFYEESNMSKDITLEIENWLKETKEDDTRRYEFIKNDLIGHKLLDFGSGAGGFLLQAKKLASSVTGLELDKKVENFYVKNNIQFESEVSKLEKEKFDVITMFHVLEHLPNPLETLNELLKSLKEDGSLIVEVPNANDALLTIYENIPFSNFTYWSCHLYLYTEHTLKKLAKKAGLKVEFVKYIQRYSLSNHMYWLSKGKPGGHKKWGNFLDSDGLKREYESSLAALGATDTIMVKLKKVKYDRK